MKRLAERVPDVWVSVSATTRAPRDGERDGVHYFFVDDATFDKMIAEDDLLEWANVHGRRYGTPKSKILEHIADGDQVILEIDVQGAFQVRDKIPEAILVFIEPPSMDELRARLEGRGTETQEAVESRMKTAELELARKMEYDYQLVNDNLDVATDELVSFIDGKANDE